MSFLLGDFWHEIEDQRSDDDIIEDDDIDGVISDIIEDNKKSEVFHDDVHFELVHNIREVALGEILS